MKANLEPTSCILSSQEKGKHSIDSIDTAHIHMKPSIKKYYRVQELTIYNIVTTVIKEFQESFDTTGLTNLLTINKHISVIIPNTIHWLQTNFSPLVTPNMTTKNKPKSRRDGWRSHLQL